MYKKVVLHKKHIHYNTVGDVWTTTWADDGKNYSVCDDTLGIHKGEISSNDEGVIPTNLAYVRFDSLNPDQVEGITVNHMLDYGKLCTIVPIGCTDGCCWKACGTACVDGVLYATVSRHGYGHTTAGDVHYRQTAHNASVIKSLDYGQTWARSAEDNYFHPMFRGGIFANPFFIDYGQNYSLKAHGSDRYVYAVSNSFYWDNGDRMLLARVSRKAIGELNPAHWQFYSGGNGEEDGSWTREIEKTKPIIELLGKCSMTGAVYIAPLDRYIMIQWYYASGSGKNEAVAKENGLENAGQHTFWDFHESPTPWGPWNHFHTEEFREEGYYNPCIASSTVSADGKRFIILT